MNLLFAPKRRRRVWRMTPDAPQGKYVYLDEVPSTPTEPQERFEPGWRQSSFELAYGLDVSETGETLPDDVVDALFNTPARPGRH